MSKIYLLQNEALMFEGLGWGIIHSKEGSYPNVYASHRECTVDYDLDNYERAPACYGEGCWYSRMPPTCQVCGEAVPDEIQALFVLFEGYDSPMTDSYKEG